MLGAFSNDCGHSVQSSLLGRSPAPLSRDQLKEIVRKGLDNNRLNHTMFADRIGELTQTFCVERFSWLSRIGKNSVNIDFLQLVGFNIGRSQQGAQSPT